MLDRRVFLVGAAAAAVHAAGGGRALAAVRPKGWKSPSGPAGAALDAIRQKAGLAAPGGTRSVLPPATGGESDYDVLLPQLVDMIRAMEQQGATRSVGANARAALTDATELLGALVEAERSPPIPDQERAVGFQYEQLRDGYLTHYDACTLRPERTDITKWHIRTLLDPVNRRQYEAVEQRLKTPWYFVGIIHSLEAGFNFHGHLHNGDPLRARTWQVPAGRPVKWNPPTDWASSASDALTMKNYNDQPDWSIAQMLFRFEKYNGFGYRRRDTPSPYLWSFSDQYAKGKYVKDGQWDPNAVSKQCGAALLVKELIAQGAITAPVRT